MKCLLLTLLAAVLPTAAHATWMGLSDGNYSITLNCDYSTVISCPGAVNGTLTIQGSEATAMDFSMNGDHFLGNPDDALFDGSLVDFESSVIAYTPDYRFLSLRLITDGQIGSYGVGDRWWVYCNNLAGQNTCTPNTTGTWTATLIGNPVPEPTSAALTLLALTMLRVSARGLREASGRSAS